MIRTNSDDSATKWKRFDYTQVECLHRCLMEYFVQSRSLLLRRSGSDDIGLHSQFASIHCEYAEVGLTGTDFDSTRISACRSCSSIVHNEHEWHNRPPSSYHARMTVRAKRTIKAAGEKGDRPLSRVPSAEFNLNLLAFFFPFSPRPFIVAV